VVCLAQLVYTADLRAALEMTCCCCGCIVLVDAVGRPLEGIGSHSRHTGCKLQDMRAALVVLARKILGWVQIECG
jgi:hypothetical protein